MARRSRDKMITFWVTEDELAKINANIHQRNKRAQARQERMNAQLKNESPI